VLTIRTPASFGTCHEPKRIDRKTPPLDIEATVAPDGQLHLTVPGLAPGQRVRVSIAPERVPAPPAPRHVIDIVENLPGRRLFKTAEEVDAYRSAERDSWDR